MEAKMIISFTYQFCGSDLAMEREKLGMSQHQLADKSGMCQQSLSALERPAVVHVREVTKKALEKGGIKFEYESTIIPIPLLEMAEEINREIERLKNKVKPEGVAHEIAP